MKNEEKKKLMICPRNDHFLCLDIPNRPNAGGKKSMELEIDSVEKEEQQKGTQKEVNEVKERKKEKKNFKK